MKIRLDLTLLFLAGIILTGMHTPALAKPLPFTRAIYKPPDFSINGSWNFSELRSLGIDAFFSPGDFLWEGVSPGWAERTFGMESASAEFGGVTFVAGQYYESGDVDFEYALAVNRYGDQEPRTAAPTDETYWKRVIEDGALFIANLSLHYPIWGVVWDVELYLSTSGWPFGSYSYDEESLKMFAGDSGLELPFLEPAERYPYLSRLGLIGSYQDWQFDRLRQMAEETAVAVAGINPDLSLGILGIQDEWFDWAILTGFNASPAPITAWSGLTYPGYDDEIVSHFQELWEEKNLDGAFLPGFYTVQIEPFQLIIDVEEAIRNDGALSIYQRDGDPYRLGTEADYRRAYEVLQDDLFSGDYDPDPLPVFDIYPACEARPYPGPEGVSVLLPYDLRFTYGEGIVVLTGRDSTGYVGANLTRKHLDGITLSPADLPCILFDLGLEDLSSTHAASMIRELGDLLDLSTFLGFGVSDSLQAQLPLARDLYDTGRVTESRDLLLGARDGAYGIFFDQLIPLYEEALENPRESTLPLNTLKSFSTAIERFEGGDLIESRGHLFRGLNDWKASVGECWFSVLVLILTNAHVRMKTGGIPSVRLR